LIQHAPSLASRPPEPSDRVEQSDWFGPLLPAAKTTATPASFIARDPTLIGSVASNRVVSSGPHELFTATMPCSARWARIHSNAPTA
jgi:hypothetical protein